MSNIELMPVDQHLNRIESRTGRGRAMNLASNANEAPMRIFFLCLSTLVAIGCSSSSTNLVSQNEGGAPASGGSGAGGNPGSGGAAMSGGTTAAGGSGTLAAGGSTTASGGSGTTASGGNASGGTTAASGGTTAIGGKTGQGGGNPIGGAGGGTVPSGGKAGSGGSAVGGASGGTATSGGKAGSGGGAVGGKAGSGGGANGGTPAAGGGGPTGGATPSGGSTSTGTQHWVGTWTASPYYDSGNQPPSSLSNSVLRQVVHVSLGGSQIRVQFSNLGGNGSVTINSAHIALCKATPAVDSTIDVATDKALAFGGTASVTIAQGKEVWSDPIDFVVANQGNISITTAFGSVPTQVVGHSGSRTTSYLATGSNVTAASMSSATAFQHWYYISGIDVMADASAVGAVAIGDSITDGRGTDNDKNNRWTDIMAARLQANAATKNVATMNQGIGATNLIGSGTGAEGRFARDVLGQSAVKYAIIFDGVNDISGGATAASMESVYKKLIDAAHAKGVLVFGATILPFNGNSYYTVAHESVRKEVNTYIKSGVFDGVIDFDAALTDNKDPPGLQATYAAWTAGNPAGSTDGLHPGPAGYQKMGETVDLTLFTK
jgi:lysophospholipase L1-like esterase